MQGSRLLATGIALLGLAPLVLFLADNSEADRANAAATYSVIVPAMARVWPTPTTPPVTIPSPPAPPFAPPTATATATGPDGSSTPAGLTFCTVSHIVDGDTIDVTGCVDAGRIRFILVDTPEVYGGTECYGKEASAYTKAALEGRKVGLEKDVSNTDRYGRYLRYIWLDGELFNERIVRDGYATLATYPPDLKYVDRIRTAQQDAYEADRGLWAPSACQGTPGVPPVPLYPTVAPAATATPTTATTCDPSYPTVCIPSPPPDLDCGDIPYRNFTVYQPDPHRFDGNKDGVGCET